MKKMLILGAMLLPAMAGIAGYHAVGVTSSHAEQSLPASLNDLYPPKAQGPIYLLAMHDLNKPLAGLVCDLLEDDKNNVQLNFERFRSQYLRVSRLVPEWESRYPEAPLDTLEAAVMSGDQGQVLQALNQIDVVCHDCHVEYMPAVHFKYHWDDFKSISVTDPLTNESASFKQFKQMMNTDMIGIGNDLEQGQIDNAKKHGQGLAARYETLKDLCMICHDSEPKYFVSDDVWGIVDTLRSVLDETPVNKARIVGLLQGIGMESCSKCHLVHVPAAYSKYQVKN